MRAMKPTFKTLDYLYLHTAGAGNTGYVTVQTAKRTYVLTLVAATANTIQFAQGETVQKIFISTKCAATGSIEVSRVSTSQIATAIATQDVLARVWIEPVTTSGLPTKEVTLEFA
jgi:hypothetical protein